MMIIVIDTFSHFPGSCKPQHLEVRIEVGDDKHQRFIAFITLYVHTSTIFRNQFNIQYFIKLVQDIYQIIKHNFMIFIFYH